MKENNYNHQYMMCWNRYGRRMKARSRGSYKIKPKKKDMRNSL